VPQPFLRFLPSEPFPAEDRAPLSGPPAPLLLFTDRAERTSRGLISAGFLWCPRRNVLAKFPQHLWDPFLRAKKGTSPGPPGLERPNRPLRPAAPTSKLYSLRQSVPPVWVSPKLKAEALLEFLPFEVFPAHDLDPRPNLPRRQLLTSPEGSVRTQRILRPFQPGEATLFEKKRRTSSAASNPLRGWPEPAFTGSLSPSALELQAHLDP